MECCHNCRQHNLPVAAASSRHVVTFEASRARTLAQAFALTIWIERGRIHAHERRDCIKRSVAMRTHVTMNDG